MTSRQSGDDTDQRTVRKAQVFDVGHVPAAAPGRAPAPGQGPGLGSLVALAVTSVLQLALQRQSSGRPLRVGRTPAVSPLPRELTPAVAVVAPTACPPSLDRYDLLVHHTNEIVYFIDDRNRIVEASAAAARAYGYTADDLLKLDIADLQPRDTRAAVKNAVERARAHETVVFGTKQRRIDGTEFPVEITLTSQRGDGAASEILAIVRDTTQHQAVEDSLTTAYDNAVDAARLKTAFVAAMSHEIRTPMNTILGMGELMLDTDLTNDQRGFSEAVRESGQALLSIIDDVLDFSQIESGGPEFEMEDVDVSAILESAVAAFASRAAKAGLSLTVRFDPRIVGAIRADASRLRRTLVHLIDNAVKFTESGGIVISATLEEGDEWTSTIRFAVEDTGSGIDETAAKVIFEAFRQADDSPTRRHAGAGLGLTIARRFIELMGGQLILQSIPGVGSTFSFSARFERGNAAAKTSAFSIAGAHALIVDDDPVAREILTRYASAWSLNADAAPNGSEAFEMLRRRAGTQTPYDVAIIDYTMPGGMGGLELGKRIKADPSLARTQLILITAYKGLQQRQAASTAGFTSYLTKPVDRAQLFDYLARSITCARAIDAGEQPAAPPRASSGASKRILLVEDNPINQHLGMQQLKKLGFDVSAANNGEQALAALAVKPFDIIFMDCQMPTMDGFAATRAIRASEEHTGGHVTIVAMTANALVEDRRTCLAAGMDDYLAKPVRIDDLETLIQRWIWDPAIAK